MVNSSFLEKKSKGSYFGGFVTGDAWKENRRTDSEIRVLAKEVAQGKMTAKETGITGESALLSCNPHFDAVYSFLPEPFHAIYENIPKLIWSKGILRKPKNGVVESYSLSYEDRREFSRRLSIIPHTHDTKRLKDPLVRKLKGDEMADFVVTASTFALEGLKSVSKDTQEIVKLQREHFLLVENKGRTQTKELKVVSKKIASLVEGHLPEDSRPITSHIVFVHLPEAVAETGNLSECNGQWIEDECGELVEEVRRRGIRVNVEQVLSRSAARKIVLINYARTISVLLSSSVPTKTKDPRLWDAPDTISFLGRGQSIVLRNDERQEIAKMLGYHGDVGSWQDMELQALEFRRGCNGVEFHSEAYTAARTSCSFHVALTFGVSEYYGLIKRFILVRFKGVKYRIVQLQLHYNTTPSPSGIPRVKENIFYKDGSYVLLENLRRRVHFVKRKPEESFYYVLEVRMDIIRERSSVL